MKKFIKIIITIFFFVLPVFLLNFVSMLTDTMRRLGSPLVPGYNYLRWSHVYLILGSLFCFVLYIPAILSIIKKRQKILLISLFPTILFIFSSIVFAIMSKNVYNRQVIQKSDEQARKNPNGPISLEKKTYPYDSSTDSFFAAEDFVFLFKTFIPVNNSVNDFANVIDKENTDALNYLIKEVELKTTEKIVVVTMNSIAPFNESEYVRLLFDYGMLGMEGYRNHVVLVFLALREKSWRIDTIYSMKNILPDAFCAEVGREYIVPCFKNGQYSEGLYYGVVALARRIAEHAHVELMSIKDFKLKQ